MNYMIYVENMKEYMKSSKMKQKAIANRTGMDINKVSRIFRKVSEPKLSELENIAFAMGKKLQDFEKKVIAINTSETQDTIPQAHFYMGEVTKKRRKDAIIYSKFAERVHFLHKIAKTSIEVEEEF